MTITIDDAGVGDLLLGVVIGAFREETQEFRYEVLNVKYFRPPRFHRKEYLKQASSTVSHLLERLRVKTRESIHICKGYIFDEAVKNLRRRYGDDVEESPYPLYQQVLVDTHGTVLEVEE